MLSLKIFSNFIYHKMSLKRQIIGAENRLVIARVCGLGKGLTINGPHNKIF